MLSEQNIKPESISKSRIDRLKQAVEKIKQKFTPEQLSSVEALIVYGSTALGLANEQSDIDLFIAFAKDKPIKPDQFKKVAKIIQDELPDIIININLGALTNPKGRRTKSITLRSAKHPERVPSWDFIYVKDEETKHRLDQCLREARKFWDSLGINQPPKQN
ncbi:MAG: nucleotidyltransferase domain-containing protein [Patescibacteria group bacterium]